MNALFGLQLQISVGESLIVGTAVSCQFFFIVKKLFIVHTFCIVLNSSEEIIHM